MSRSTVEVTGSSRKQGQARRRQSCSKPDADNAAKAVMDALTTLGLWRDDAQVVSLIVRKTFGAAAEVGARVTVATLEELAS